METFYNLIKLFSKEKKKKQNEADLGYPDTHTHTHTLTRTQRCSPVSPHAIPHHLHKEHLYSDRHGSHVSGKAGAAKTTLQWSQTVKPHV